MKRLTYLLIFVASLGYSQSNLVFNQVLNFRLNNVTSATVPDGKVWKVEHSNSDILASKQVVTYGLPLNSNSEFLPTSNNSNSVWFSEGTVLRTSVSTNLSILEFDVVPVSTTSTGSGGLSSEGLEFNQVINYSETFSFSGSYNQSVQNLGTFNIPEGKVWKIVNVMVGKKAGTGEGFTRQCDACSASFNDIIAYIYFTGGYTPDNAKFPIWLSSGTYNFNVADLDGSSGGDTLVGSFSAIEYNIPQ